MTHQRVLGKCLFVFMFISAFIPAVNAAGTLDLSFSDRGSLNLTDGIRNPQKIFPVSGNKFLIVGTCSNSDSVCVTRHNEDGSFDSSFNNGSSQTLPFHFSVYSIASQPDNKILFTGTYRTAPSPFYQYGAIICRLNTDGSFDSTFNSTGCYSVNRYNPEPAIYNGENFSGLYISSNGKILTISNVFSDAVNLSELFRLNSDGTPDLAFGNNGYLNFNNTNLSDITPAPTGKFLLSTGLGVFRLDENLTVDRNFGNNGISEYLGQFAFQTDGKILVSGSPTRRLTANGQIDPTFPARYVSYAIEVLPNGKVIILGPNLVQNTGNSKSVYLLTNKNQLVGVERTYDFVNIKGLSDNKILALSQARLEKYEAITSFANPTADLDSDEVTDISVYNPSTRIFTFLKSQDGLQSYMANNPVGRIIPENYAGDLRNELVWWKTGSPNSCTYGFYSGMGFPEQPCYYWGLPTDEFIGGDYDGDQLTDFAVFRQGFWHIRKSTTGESLYYNWGMTGDKPVAADYDADGISDAAIYRPSSGEWWVLRSSDGNYTSLKFGIAEDKPVVADYDGDGQADYAVYRPTSGMWYLQQSKKGFYAMKFGIAEDQPVPGDYDGDGRTDIAVFRPSNGYWYLWQSMNGFRAVKLGESGDIPISTAYAAY